MFKIPIVSVIMATYNRSQLVARAIESILGQTLTDFEFIIINDGSTDRTAQILNKYALKDKRIIILNQNNQGLAVARNLGVTKAKSKYISFMDDDDISLPLRLERQLMFLENNPQFHACTCGFVPINTKGDIIAPNISPALESDENTGNGNIGFQVFPRPLITNHPVYLTLGSTTFISKDIFIKCGGYRTSSRIIEDLDFTLRFLEKYSMALIAEVLYCYTKPSENYGNNMSTTNIIRFIKTHIASYLSAWFRIANMADPVEQGESLEEINQLIYKLPLRVRYIIYKSLLYMVDDIQKHNNGSYAEIIHYLTDLAGLKNKLMVLYCQLLYWSQKTFPIIKRKLLNLTNTNPKELYNNRNHWH